MSVCRSTKVTHDLRVRQGIQRGYRGVAMETVYNLRFLQQDRDADVVPKSVTRLPEVGAKTRTVHRNLQVPGDLGIDNSLARGCA